MSCDPFTFPPREISSDPGEQSPFSSCLIMSREQAAEHSVSGNRETDSRTALKRGLANYLMSLPVFTHPTHGREVQLRKIYDVWPDTEEKTAYPSATVYSTDPHPYEASGFTPTIDPDCKIDAMTYLVKTGEVNFNLTIDILTTDPEERICFGMQMEDALSPVDWMSGFQLELAHYHNLRGVYQIMEGNYPDDEPSVFSRNRHLTYKLSAQVSVVRIQKITPLTEVRTDVTVVDGNDPC